MKSAPEEKKAEVVEYGFGLDGYQDAIGYDALRYMGRANEYKQAVMANAYTKLIGPLKDKSVLDVGCGTGRGIAEFGREARLAMGTDASMDMLSIAARKTAGLSTCFFAKAVAQQLPFADAVFDVVTSLNFLHLFEPKVQQEMISEMKRVVKPGGILVLEFDNALHGVVVGPYKRWSGREGGSLPSEIRYAIGSGCRIAAIYSAVFPVIWRVFCHLPRLFIPFEKIAYFFPFNHLSHRIYYKLIRIT
jgi:ubiquinone/menaquinone biosynthesis C-methylase UbiE